MKPREGCPMRERLLFVFALTAAPALAQQTGITGRLTDPSNAVMANVVITASAEDGTKLATHTKGQEMYETPAVRAGKYVLRFEIPGFVPAERTLTVLVGQVATADVAVQLASASTTVAVEAAAAAGDTSTSTVAGDVSPTEVSRVPLNGRNYLQLAMMVPGITSNDVTNSPLGTTDGGKLQINVDGQQVTQNSAGDGFGEPQYSQDAIDQFQIITNRFDATLGRSSRIQVNVQTESRTNSYLLHADWLTAAKHRLSVRATGYTWAAPFNNVTGSSSPTRATDSTRTSYAVLGTWTWTASATVVNELRAGLNHFDWQNVPLIQSQEYPLPTITLGAAYNYPQQLGQRTQQYRDRLLWLQAAH